MITFCEKCTPLTKGKKNHCFECDLYKNEEKKIKVGTIIHREKNFSKYDKVINDFMNGGSKISEVTSKDKCAVTLYNSLHRRIRIKKFNVHVSFSNHRCYLEKI